MPLRLSLRGRLPQSSLVALEAVASAATWTTVVATAAAVLGFTMPNRTYFVKNSKRQRVPLLLHAPPQQLFLSAIKAGATPDSDIDHCYKILLQLATVQSERSLAREFFHRDQNLKEPSKDAPAKVTSWVAVQYCAGVQPPTIATRLNAMKTNDLNQLVKAETKIHVSPTAKSAASSLEPSHKTPRAALCKLEGYPCRFLLDSKAVKSLVNPEASPDLFRKIRARSSSIKLLSAEGRKMKAIGETSLKITIGKKS
ncbi:unnamed protein product [Taenia asiatica]|uniref:DUF5726 domain-containing protein n=1 Tax=Taenia asiatica TaxID=60517 RepID=A0A0R3WGV1_TAEAS|nr:unnamed protein product [Taenia asiatica]